MMIQAIIRQLSTGPFEFWVWDGSKYIFDQEIEQPDAPIEEPILAELEAGRITRWEPDRRQPFRDERNKIIAKVAIVETEDEADKQRPLVEQSARDLEGWLRWMAKGKWNVEVHPAVVIVPDRRRVGLSTDWSDIQAEVRAKYPGVNFTYWQLNVVWSGEGNAGVAYLNAERSLVYDVTNIRTSMHELGHCFGLGHDKAGTLMSTNRRHQFSGSSMEWIGLADRIGYVDDSQRLHLVAPEARGFLAGEMDVAYVNDAKQALSVYGQGEVMVHEHVSGFGRQGPWSQVAEIGTLRHPGDTWQNVELVRWIQGSAEIAVGNPPAKEPPEVPFQGREAIKTGLWYSDKYTHQGLDYHTHKDENGDLQAVVHLFTWGEGEGLTGPLWLIGQGPTNGTSARVKFQVPRPNRRERVMEDAGEAIITVNDGVLTCWYWTTFADRWWPGRGILHLDKHVPVTDNPLYGVYDFGDREGISVLPVRDDWLIALWWGYVDPINPRPMWWWLEGSDNENLVVYQPEGGFPETPTQSRLQRWGKATVRRKSFTAQPEEQDAKLYKTERLI